MAAQVVTAARAEEIPGPEWMIWPKQLEFLMANEPTVTYQGGSGSGKSYAGALKAIQFAHEHPGCTGMVVGSSYKSIEQGIKKAWKQALKALPLAMRPRWHGRQEEQFYEWPNGSVMWVRSATNPDVIPGADLSYLWGDEIARWPERAYNECQGRLREPGFPHQMWLTYTPKGRNWAYREFAEERQGLRIIRTSTRENLAISEDFHQRLVDTHGIGSAWWRQEALGEFVAFEGLIYAAFSEDRHVIGDPLPRFARVIGAADWGWANPGCLLVLGLTADDAVIVIEEVYEPEKPPEWWREQALDLRRRYPIERFYCDPSEPENVHGFVMAGLPATGAANAVIPGIGFVNGRLRSDRLLVHQRCQNTIDELGLYAWKTRAGGEVRPDEPEKVHDHAMDALRYGVMALEGPSAVLQSAPRRAHARR